MQGSEEAGGDRAPEGMGMGAPRNSLEDEEEDGGGEDEQQREREDPAVAGQHEAAPAVEAVAAREHLPLAPRAVADAAAAAAAPARCSGGRLGPGARTRGRGGAGAARPWGGGRRGGPGADLLVLTVLHAAAAGLASAPRGPAAPHRDPAKQRSWRRRAALAHSLGAAPPHPPPPPPARPPAAAPPPPGPGMALGPAPGPAPVPAPASPSAPSWPGPFCTMTGQQMRTQGFPFPFKQTICWAAPGCRAPCQAPRFGGGLLSL